MNPTIDTKRRSGMLEAEGVRTAVERVFADAKTRHWMASAAMQVLTTVRA